MTQLSKNFKRSEFACPCGCGFDTVDAELLRVLQWLRDQTMQPVRVNSGCRCDLYNTTVGGTPLSYHKKGKAADIVVVGIHPRNVAKYLSENLDSKRFGIGLYSNFVHIDVRDRRARWSEEDEGKPIERPKI